MVKHVLLGVNRKKKKKKRENKAWKIEFGDEASSADVHNLFSFVGFVYKAN